MADSVGTAHCSAPGGDFFQHECATLKRVFPQILVFPVFYPGDATQVQNLVLVATASSEVLTLAAPELRPFLAHLRIRPIPAAFELTDDFAPVEHMAARQLATSR